MSFRSSDISALLVSQPLRRAVVPIDDGPMEAVAQGTPQGAAEHAVVVAAVTGCAAAAVAAVAAVLVLIIRRTRVRQQESDRAVIIRDMPGFMEASYSLDGSTCRNFLCNFDTLSLCTYRRPQPGSYHQL